MRRSLLSITETADPFEVFASNFDDLTGLVINTSNGTVTASNIIGTVTPNTPNALTIEHTSAGSVNASVDLGQAYDELYVQYYVSVIKQINASSYTNNFEVGSAIEANHASQIVMNHSGDTWRVFSQDGNGFHNLNKRTNSGSWNKIGMYFSGGTVEYFVNDTSIGTFNTISQDRRYITMGGTGNNQVGYKVQYASLTVNTDHFQDIITNSSVAGAYNSAYTSQFVDYSIITDTAYDDGNGAFDLTALDVSGWTGLHSRPYDPDGGTNYIDGPAAYLFDIGTSNDLALLNDKFFAKRGVVHKMENLTRAPKISLSTSGFSSTVFNTIDAYGTGDDPKIDLSIRVNPDDWTLHDAVNSIYKVSIANADEATGVFIEDVIGLREVTVLSNMDNQSGCWFENGTEVYARLYDDTDPSLQNMAISSNQNFKISEYGEVRNIDFRHGLVLFSGSNFCTDSSFGQGSLTSVTNSEVVGCTLYDGWGGRDYYLTEAENPGLGLGTSGQGGGIGLREGAIVHNCIIENAYLSVAFSTDSHDAIFAYNQTKNTIINQLSIVGGEAAGDPLRPIIIGNNTGFAAPRGLTDDPYPLSRPAPGHGFVVQSQQLDSYFRFFNNMMLLDYEPSIAGNASVMNIMSFTTNALTYAHGRLGYNVYHITPNSVSPAVIFNQGAANDISTWRTNLAANGDFTDMDGTSNPDTTSTVETVLPVTTAVSANGKWGATDGTPINIGGGYDFDYSVYGITHDLSGNPITSTKNIGAY